MTTPPFALPYRNNLKKGDPVLEITSRRPGTVAKECREASRSVSVTLQGTKTPKAIDILNLRLVVDGAPEEVPPCDGTPNPPRSRTPRSPEGESSAANGHDALSTLRLERSKHAGEMRRLETEFKKHRDTIDRLDQAILILDPAQSSTAKLSQAITGPHEVAVPRAI